MMRFWRSLPWVVLIGGLLCVVLLVTSPMLYAPPGARMVTMIGTVPAALVLFVLTAFGAALLRVLLSIDQRLELLINKQEG